MQLDIFDQSYNPNTSDSQSRRVINMYIEETQDPNTQLKFLSTPGYTEYKDLSGSVVRGALEHADKAYIVKDNKVIQLTDDASKTTVELGTLSTTTGRVAIASIFDEILFADGDKVWSFIPSTSTWAEVTDADLPADIAWITSHLGYFLAVSPGTDQFFVSDLNDGTSWNALSFDSAEIDRDTLTAILPINQTVWMLGDRTMELWYNDPSIASPAAPYSRRSGGARPIGCAAAFTSIVIGGNGYWLAQNDSGLIGIVEANESGVKVISTRPMLESMNSYTSIDDAFAWTYTVDSHVFYVITFPDTETARGRTWQYDISTGKWTELESVNPTQPLVEPYTRHTANCHVYLNRKHLIGDFASGKLYELSSSAYDEDGNTIRRQITSAHIRADRKYISMNQLEVNVQNDIGTVSEDPDIVLEVSKDEGNTWPIELTRQAGVLGEHKDRVLWSRLGSGRSFTLRFTMTDPVKWSFLGARADIQGNRS